MLRYVPNGCYDNENSYTSQMVRTIKYFEKFVA